MRAIRVSSFGGPAVLKLVTDAKIPDVGPTQVLMKVHTAGVNPVDTYIRAGTFSTLPSLPFIPGSDACGIIHKVGEEVKSFKEGDRVYAAVICGSNAEFCPCEEWQVYPLPESLSFADGAALGVPYFTVFRALFTRMKAQPTETVLVHGASGGVGLAAVQIAKAKNMVVIGTAGTEEGMALVKNAGASHVFNHRSPNYAQEIMSATGDKGVNVILEMLANVNLDRDLDLLSRHGRVAVIGSRGQIKIDPRKTMGKESCVMGVALRTSTKEEYMEYTQMVQEGADAGWLRPVIGREYKLEEASTAHHDIIHTKSGAKGKIILKISE